MPCLLAASAVDESRALPRSPARPPAAARPVSLVGWFRRPAGFRFRWSTGFAGRPVSGSARRLVSPVGQFPVPLVGWIRRSAGFWFRWSSAVETPGRAFLRSRGNRA